MSDPLDKMADNLSFITFADAKKDLERKKRKAARKAFIDDKLKAAGIDPKNKPKPRRIRQRPTPAPRSRVSLGLSPR